MQCDPKADRALVERQKRGSQKSRAGCVRCKGRRLKCDKKIPKCDNCDRAGISCLWTAATCSKTGFRQSQPVTPPVPSQLHLARLSSRVEALAFEYFERQTLPLFRASHPSLLWEYTIGFSVQTNATLRHIAVALGFQQRLAEGRGINAGPAHRSLVEQSDVFYGKALRSLRETLATDTTVDAPIITLGCLLLITLESLRGSPKDLLVHLRNSVRITVDACKDERIGLNDELHDIASLLQHACISAFLYCASPAYDGDFALILQDIDFRQLSALEFPNQWDVSSFAVHSLLSKVIYTIRQMIHPQTKPRERMAVFDELYRLRAKARHLESRLLSQTEKTVGRNFLQSKLVMVQVFLSATLTQQKDCDAEDRAFGRALDLLQDSLVELLSREHRRDECETTLPLPLCIGTGIIQILETIIRTSQSPLLKAKALDLLRICPPREGLWTSSKILRAHDVLSATIEIEETASPRRPVAIEAEDGLATTEDCVNIAQQMLEELQL